jgi:hypothetical protein
MNHASGSDNSLVLSYLDLRKAVGIIGTALPFALAFGNILLGGHGIQSSISNYYHTPMRDIFVGSLCAIAVFLVSYRGYERIDAIAGDLASIFAVGVALFPTTPEGEATPREELIGWVHISFAGLFFLTLAFFSLALFRKTNPNKAMTRRKLQRNAIYTLCGYAILACLALLAIFEFMPEDAPVKKLDPVFWLEAAAIVAFGVSWLTKGQAILKDEESNPQP